MKLLQKTAGFIAMSLMMSMVYAQGVNGVKVVDSISMITGKGGNIGVLTGKDGTFLIDDKFAPDHDGIMSELKKLGGDTPRFVINTHYHGDHTGGNDKMGELGSVIVSHENARRHMSSDQFIAAFNKTIPAKTAAGLPIITFTRDMTFHLNGQTVKVMHVPTAHTDGDSIIQFVEANVVHTGDTMFNGFYPFIDVPHGGNVKGMIAAADAVLALSNEQTKIIPGHGPLATKQDLQNYRNMLATVQEKLGKLKAAGKSASQAIAVKPLAEFDKEWSDGLFKTDRWIEIIYDGI